MRKNGMNAAPKTVSLIISNTLDVYQNQASELAIFETVAEDELCLFLWTNDHTVVVGRNQDALTECRVEQLNNDGGKVARRLSGGGAVYHDIGNLNFTFCARGTYFSKVKNFEVIMNAMKESGFDVEISGRNDLTVSGRKFSGNAYYHDCDRHLHHGTILIDTDGTALAKYLTPSIEKLKTKGVSSVEARVVNLKSINNDFDKNMAIDALKYSLKKTFQTSQYIEKSESILPAENLLKNLQYFSQRKWILGEQMCYNFRCKLQLDFGLCEVRCFAQNGVIETAKIFTDALDVALVERIEKLLAGSSLNCVQNEETKEILLALREVV
ncbi:MAG: lipoate--protein ligase [Clostridia bacterium]|nr:lipoate--protein ligase [Clostridia bacterium]